MVVLGALFSVGIGACASDPSEDVPANPESDESDLKTKRCGGIAGTRCQDADKCVITSRHPDATGTCQTQDSWKAMSCPTVKHCMVMGGSPEASVCTCL
jgi:hypothetical protein